MLKQAAKDGLAGWVCWLTTDHASPLAPRIRSILTPRGTT